ncbi:MAG: SDR family oxidoreductase [Trueperaceae bacterium]
MNGSLWRLDGRHALVTGATSGIGKAVAEMLLERGASVTIVARNAERLQNLATTWQEQGLKVKAIEADVSQEAGREKIMAGLGNSLDILINNVGGDRYKPFHEYRAADFEHVFNINVISAAEMSRLCRDLLMQSNHACIVNNASVAGVTYVSTSALYSLTKAALIHLTSHLALEWAKLNIRVNAVAPWLTRTELTDKALDNPDFMKRVEERTPMGRIATVEEIAATMVFLALDASAYMTGQCLTVDGGLTLNSA